VIVIFLDETVLSEKLIGKDIRYIKKGDVRAYRLDNKNVTFSNFYFYFFISVLLPFISFFGKQRYLKRNGNISQIRNKKATAFALKRLKKAQLFRKQGDFENFYKSIEGAVYKYLADKFNISSSGIVISEVSEKIREHNVGESVIELLEKVLNKCASVQYSPLKENIDDEMTNDFENCKNLLLELQNNLK